LNFIRQSVIHKRTFI